MMRERTRVGAVVIAVVVTTSAASAASAACGGDRRAPGVEVRDSAGIEIVASRDASEAELPASGWRVTDEPVVRIGSREGAEPEQFTLVGAATRLSDGRIVVLERSVSEVRFFGADGSHQMTVGGEGEGPGEFRRAMQLARVPGDSLLVYDWFTDALAVFTASGELARLDRPDPVEVHTRYERNRTCRALPIFADGTYLGCARAPELPSPPPLGPGRQPESGIRERTGFRVVRIQRDTARVDALGTWLGPVGFTMVDGDMLSVASHPFYPESHAAVGADPMRFYLAHNPAYEIEVWHPDGQLERILRRPEASLAPTEEARAEARQVTLDGLWGDFADRFADRIVMPDTVPAVWGLTAGPDGELWVRRGPVLPSVRTSDFDVFDGDGVYRGTVSVPRPVALLEVGPDYFLALRRDEVDVPYVEMWGLERGR